MDSPRAQNLTATGAQVLAALADIGSRPGALTAHRRVQEYMRVLEVDIVDVMGWLIDCDPEDIVKHEADYDPQRTDYIVELKILVEDERQPFYVKIAIHMPEMTSAHLLSLKPD